MKTMSVTDTDLLGDLLFGAAHTLWGSRLEDDELIRLAQITFKKHFCIVRHWMMFNVMLPESVEREVKAQGLTATILYSPLTVFDSEGTHRPGETVFSAYLLDFDGCIFESKETVYVLAGRGFRKYASVPALQALRAYKDAAMSSQSLF